VDVGALAVPIGERHHTFAPSMSQSTPDPEQVPSTPDEVARLEEMHQRMKDQHEAWRKLLENLDKLKQRTNAEPTNETPST
jgi:hypothetical protein